MSDELFERFRKTAADSLSKPIDEIKVEANFADDLDADSLDLVQMVMDLEEEFDITVDEEELEGIGTVSQAFDLIKSKLCSPRSTLVASRSPGSVSSPRVASAATRFGPVCSRPNRLANGASPT